MTNIKEDILRFIKKIPNRSFAELTQIEGVKGEYEWLYKENLVLFSGLSMEAINSINELIAEEKIQMNTCNAIIYFIDGLVPKYPVAKKIMDYKKQHWLPVTFK